MLTYETRCMIADIRDKYRHDPEKERARHRAPKALARSKEYYQAHKEHMKFNVVRRTRELRQEVIAGYGGKCACCGEAVWEFLAVDHVNGGGKQDRKETGNSAALYRKIIKAGFPDTYRILCHNCNAARGFYGYCPHEVKN